MPFSPLRGSLLLFLSFSAFIAFPLLSFAPLEMASRSLRSQGQNGATTAFMTSMAIAAMAAQPALPKQPASFFVNTADLAAANASTNQSPARGRSMPRVDVNTSAALNADVSDRQARAAGSKSRPKAAKINPNHNVAAPSETANSSSSSASNTQPTSSRTRNADYSARPSRGGKKKQPKPAGTQPRGANRTKPTASASAAANDVAATINVPISPATGTRKQLDYKDVGIQMGMDAKKFVRACNAGVNEATAVGALHHMQEIFLAVTLPTPTGVNDPIKDKERHFSRVQSNSIARCRKSRRHY